MRNFGIFMLIFAICLLLTGFYMYKGNEIGILTGRAAFSNLDEEGWSNIGRWTMIVSLFIFLIAFLAILFGK
ncbi:MAG: hypothetical protein IJH00_01950 [Erysipelotrichaceae bacterium]|nr:hypothetical protein [Erysipelotrichaceae bacterium]